jgi:hypothetical protein
MARALTAAMLAAVQSGRVRPVLIAKIGTAAADLRVWTGIGNLTFESEIYSGVGNFGGVSEIQETNELMAAGLTYTLSGVPSEIVSIALGQMRYGRPAVLWFGLIDETTNSLITDPYKMFSGLTDVPMIDEGFDTATISITAENRLIDLERPRVRRYTTEDQKLDDATDKGFEFVPGLQDAVITWGRQ